MSKRRQIKRDRVTGNHRQDWSTNNASNAAPPLASKSGGRLMIVHQPERKLQMKKAVAQLDEITRPAHGDGHVAHGVFQNQVPTDDPRHNLAECRVGICIGRARDRNHRREFGVTKRRECTSDARHDERHSNGGACTRTSKHDACTREPGLNKIDDWRFKTRRKCLAGRSGSRQRENSRANDGADAEAGQRERPERAFHLSLRRLCFGDQMIRAFRSEQLKCHRARSCHQAVASVNPKLCTNANRAGPR